MAIRRGFRRVGLSGRQLPETPPAAPPSRQARAAAALTTTIPGNPKIAACCSTFARPKLLGRTIECFLRQTYLNSELVILDDGNQYPSQPSGDRWRVVSVAERLPNLGTKRNAVVRLVSPDVDMIQTWDDDDVFLPHMLAACVAALRRHPWAQARQALEWDGTCFRRFETFNRRYPHKFAYHGNWCYRLPEFWKVGGYPPCMDDDTIAERMFKAYGPSGDTISPAFPTPGYAYSRVPADNHLSWQYAVAGMDAAWRKMDTGPLPPAEINVGWDLDYSALAIPDVAEPRAW